MVIPSGQLGAIAEVRGDGNVYGTVKFYPVPKGTLVAAEFTGLPDGGLCWLHLHTGILAPLQSRNGRAFLAVETAGIQAWDLQGKRIALSLDSVPGQSIGTGQVVKL